MFEIIDPWAVLVATIVAYLAGWAWYSPLLWQKPWMEARGDNGTNWENDGKKEMPKIMAYGFLSTLATAYALAVFISISDVVTLMDALRVGLLLCFGFVITLKFSDLIYTNVPPHYGKRAQRLFLIDVGYQILLFSILSSVIWWISRM